VDDVDAMCAELKSRGVKMLNGPIDRPWGVRTASFMDPAGHIYVARTCTASCSTRRTPKGKATTSRPCQTFDAFTVSAAAQLTARADDHNRSLPRLEQPHPPLRQVGATALPDRARCTEREQHALADLDVCARGPAGIEEENRPEEIAAAVLHVVGAAERSLPVAAEVRVDLHGRRGQEQRSGEHKRDHRGSIPPGPPLRNSACES